MYVCVHVHVCLCVCLTLFLNSVYFAIMSAEGSNLYHICKFPRFIFTHGNINWPKEKCHKTVEKKGRP